MDFEIRRGTRGDVERLEPMWRALRSHHATLADMPGVRSAEESWETRRHQYLDWLATDGFVLLLAERGAEVIGYAVVSIGEGPATWDIGGKTAEIETLSVLESERGRGVGHALTEAAWELAREEGARGVMVAVAHSNEDALGFYEREGFGPFYVLLLRS